MATVEKEVGERVRLTVDLSAQLSTELDNLAADTGRTKAELLRLGLDYLSRANSARKDGMKVGAWSDDPENKLRKEREFVGGL